jgi:hypothetical protein
LSFKKCSLQAGITSEDMAEIREHIRRANGNEAQGVQDYLDGLDADLNDLRNQTGTQLVTEQQETPGEVIGGDVVDLIKGQDGYRPERVSADNPFLFLFDPNELTITETEFKDVSDYKGDASKPVSVAEHDGEYLILDGHHRVKLAQESGEKVKATIIPEKYYLELDAKGVHPSDMRKEWIASGGYKEALAQAKPTTLDQAQEEFDFSAEIPKLSKSTPEEAHKDAKKEAGKAVDSLRRVKGSILANAMSKDFKNERVSSIVGKEIKNTKDLASAVQIYRNPSFETLRYFFVKDGVIVGQTGVTSRLPGETKLFPDRHNKAEDFNFIREHMSKVGADGYYLMHNHPSGSPLPSDADLSSTGAAENNVEGFLGHVIVNEKKYVSIDPGGEWVERSIEKLKPEYDMSKPAKSANFLGTQITGPDTLGLVGTEFYRPDWVVVIGRSGGDGKIRGIAEIPKESLDLPPVQLLASLREFMRVTGSADVALANVPAHKIRKPALTQGVQSGLLLDVLDTSDSSLRARGVSPRGSFDSTAFGALTERKRPDGSTILEQSQKDKAEPRGQIAILPDSAVIKLYEAANLSTFLHESGHLFLEMTGKLYSHAKATPEIKADGDAILKYLGAESFDRITVEQHEKWARGMEKYFGEGKAPSLELQGAFRRFTQWIKQVYKTLTNLNVELNDDIRQVMDRMLASDDQIARLRGNFKPLFESAEEAGMTKAEFKAYDGNAQPEAAKEELFKKLVKELRRKETKWWKDESAALKKDIIKELETKPVYSAEKFLREPENIPLAQNKSQKRMQDFERQAADMYKKHDTVLTFIAKAGGLNRQDFALQGVDPESFKIKSKVFGKPVFPKSGGLTADGVAEAINEMTDGSITANDAVELVNDALTHDYFIEPDAEAEYQQLVADAQEIRFDVGGFGSNRLLKSEIKQVIPGRIPRRLNGLSSDFGSSADSLAPLYGFASGEEMILALAESKPIGKQADELAEIEMLAKHGDALNDGRIEEMAQEAMRNDSRAKKLLAELRAISRKSGKTAIDRESMREFARTKISTMKIRELSPAKFRAAEIRSARAAAVAKSKGDIDGAQKAKTQEIINFYLGKEATLAKDKAEKIRASHKQIQSKTYNANQVDTEYVSRAKLLIRVFDFRRSSRQTAQLHAEQLEKARLWIESQRVESAEDASPYLVQAEILGRLIPYNEMTVDDLNGLNDTVMSLMKAARENSNNSKAQFKREMDAVGDSIVDNRIDKYETELDNDTPYVKTKELFRGIAGSLRKLDSFARQADGMNEQGPVWKAVIKPLLDASRKALDMRNKAGEDLKAIFDGFEGVFGTSLAGDLSRDALKKMGVQADGNKKTFTFASGQVQRLSYGARISMALNMGNDGNYLAMTSMSSMPLNDQDISKVLSTLTDRDWDLVQGIWDYIDTYWPMAAELEKSRSGAAPMKVQGRSLKTPSGRTMKGGYYPLSYDPAGDTKLGDIDTQAMKFMQGGSVSKATKTGSLIERTQSGGKKINFSINVLFNHIDEIIHDVSHWQAVFDVNKALGNHRVDAELTKSLGTAGVKAMNQRLKEVAAGPQRIDALQWWERPLRYARLAVTYGALGYSVSTSIKNMVGLTTAVPEVGAANLLESSLKIMGSWSKSEEFINSKSSYMVERGQVINRDIAQIRASIRTNRKIDKFKDYAFWFMTQTDKIVTRPIWMAAYNKGQTMFDTDAEAIDFADQTVRRTQGSGDTMDLSNVETRSELMKTMTVMYSAMNAIYNIAAEQRLRYKSGNITTMELFNNIMWLTVYPGLVMALISGSSEDDEPEEILGKMGGEILGQTLGLLPVLRDVYSLARYGSSFPTPIVDVATSPVEFVKQVSQGELDKGLLRAGTGILAAAHIPGSAQMDRTFGYLIDMADNEIESFSPWELIVTGKE